MPVFSQDARNPAPLSVFLKGFLHGIDTEEFWSYDGSLTTPPCTEGIKWSVLKDVQPISSDELDWFTKMW